MTSIVVTSGSGGPIQMDNENLRRKLALQREENTILMRQNQDLLQSMEKLTWEFSKAQGKIKSLDGDRNSSPAVTSMKEKLYRLEADNKKLEERLEEYHRLLEGASSDKVDWKSRLDMSNQEVKEERELRMKAESDQRACVIALEEAQRQVARLSEETRGRLGDAETKVRGLEAQLRDARSAEQQRRELATRLTGVEEERNRLRRAAQECEQKDMEVLSLRTELARQKQRGVQREAEADSSSAARVEAETRLGKELARAEALQAELSVAQTERDRAREEAAECRRQVDAGCERLSQLERSMDALSARGNAEVERLQAEVEEARRVVRIREEEAERQRAAAAAATRAESEVRTELEAAQVKLGSLRTTVERSGERARETETLVGRMEEESKRREVEMGNLRQENARLACELASTEQRLSLRDARVSELSKETEKHRESDAKLDKEVRAAQARISGLETSVGELTLALEDAQAKAKRAEEKVQRSEMAMSDLRGEHQLRGRQLEELRSDLSKSRAQHTAQVRERQEQAEALSTRLERTRAERQAAVTEAERQKSGRTSAEAEVASLQQRLAKAEAELAEQQRRSDTALQTLEKRAAAGSDHMQRLQQELKSCMGELQELYASQQWYESELRAAKAAAENSKVMAEEAGKAVAERQKRLEASHRRQEALERQLKESLAINMRVGELEGQLDERQRLLDAAQNRAAHSEAELRRTKEAIRDMDSEIEQRRSELAAATRDLSNLRMEYDCARTEHEREMNAKLANEKALRGEVSRFDAELTRTVRERDEALQLAECSRVREQELEQRSVRAETEMQGSREELRRLAVNLETARAQLQARTERVAELEAGLRHAESIASERARDVSSLEGTLRSRTSELEKRAAQLRDLETTVEIHGREQAAKVSCLERELTAAKDQICKQAKVMAEEAVEKEGMQASMAEKTDIMRLAEHKLKQLSKEVEKKGKRNRELQMDVSKMAEERNTLLDEVRGVKEETSSLAADLRLIRERLSNVEREKERLSQCLADSTELLRIKGEEVEALNEEMNSLRVKHAQVESRADAEIRALRRQLDDVKVERHTEIGQIKESTHERVASKAREVNDLTKRLHAVESDLRRATSDLQHRESAIADLESRLHDQEKALRDTAETVTVKDSAIARLEAKLNQASRLHGVQIQELRSRSSSPSPAARRPPPSPALSHSPKPAAFASDEPNVQSLLRRVNARIERSREASPVPLLSRRSADLSETMGEVSELDSDEETPELEITSPSAVKGSVSMAERELEATEAKLAALQARLEKVQTVAECENGKA